MRKTSISMLVAVAIIGGWFLRVASEKVPGWDPIEILVALTLFNAVTEVIHRQVDKASKPAGDGR